MASGGITRADVEYAIGRIIFWCVVLLVFAVVYIVVIATMTTTCSDGTRVPTFGYNDPERVQSGVTVEGYPITCDGKIHPDKGCSFLFSGVCMINSSNYSRAHNWSP